MGESTADIITRMQARYAGTLTARRKSTDTSNGRANASQTSGYGEANSLSSRRRGGIYPNTYRPRAKDFAGMDAPTTRPTYGSVKPSSGIPVTRPAYGSARLSRKALESARATGEDGEYRAWVRERQNTARDAGETASPMYPAGRNERGNLTADQWY